MDIFYEDIATRHDDLLKVPRVTQAGGRHWPVLFYAFPKDVRPLTLSLTVPAGSGPHPLVIWIHGGAWRQGHPEYSNPILEGMKITDSLLAAGYAVARVSYRFAGEGVFPTQIHDCSAAIRYLRHHAGQLSLDPGRFAAMGESAGGHLALLSGLDLPAALRGKLGITGVGSQVQAVVNWYGVADLLTMDEQAIMPEHARNDEEDMPLPVLLGHYMRDDYDNARMASPVTHVSAQAAPVLTQHGTRDRLVPHAQALQLQEALQAVGVRHDLHSIEGADHCFQGAETDAIMPRAIAFLDEVLRPRP